MKVAILIGSESDFDMVQEALSILDEFHVPYALEVASAHRSPERTVALVREFENTGVEVFIAAAGMSAHLAGTVAAHTLKPVIGVPAGEGPLNGFDALLSTVQMPKGVPVACMGIGKSGAVNAALLAVEILSLQDVSLRAELKKYRDKLAAEVASSSQKIKDKQ